MSRARVVSTPLTGVDLLLADLDGVVYAGANAIPYAVDGINRAQASCRVGYITNNASRTAESVAAHLREFGLTVTADEVVTSPQAAVVLLAGLVPAGSTILVVGGEGLTSVVEAAGFRVTRSAEDDPAAVVQGFAPSVGWADLAEAAYALHSVEGREDRPNTDWTIPQARGIAPGNGTLVSAVHTAIGRLPIVAGKPETAIFTAALERFGGKKALMLGDRLDTDILGANRAGIASAHVLTGIDQAKQLLAAPAEQRPTFILDDLRQLDAPYPEIEESVARDGSREFRSGDARVRLRGPKVELRTPKASRIDIIRAGCAAVWGSGLAIYALDVDARLYSDA